MVEHLLGPHPDRDIYGRIRPIEVSVPHVAAGIWLATIAVLVLPPPSRQRHRVTEGHLIKAYGVVMSAFPLL